MKKIIAAICLVLLLILTVSGCGNRIEERSAELKEGMTYAEAVEILGKKGEDIGEDDTVFSWDCGDGKTLLVWLTIPYDDHDHSDPTHTHNYEYPDQLVIRKIEITGETAEAE